MSDRVNKDHSQVEEHLNALKLGMPMNGELKRELRSRFQSEPKSAKRKIWPMVAVAAMLALVIGSTSLGGLDNQSVLAAELQIVEQFSFIDLITGQYGPPAVHGEQLYLPVYDKGIYRFDTTSVVAGEGLTPVLDHRNANQVAVNHAGDKLAYMTSKGVYILDLNTGETRPAIEGDDFTIYYEDPVWSPDDQSLLVTRREIEWQVHGHKLMSLEIQQIDLATGKARKLAEGSSPSITSDGGLIVFERDGNVIVKALRSQSFWPWDGLRKGAEQTLYRGRFPRVSPDGTLIAFVGTKGEMRLFDNDIQVRENVMDVYVVNLKDPSDQKQITANYPFSFTDEREWAKNAAQGSVLNVNGYYSYYNPVWGSDSQSLYVLKSDHSGAGMRLMRISLAKEGLDQQALVAKWLSASVNRDTDAARGLMLHPQDFSATSNPHPVGYTLVGSGQENGLDYVDALQYVAYTAQPWYQVRELRFFLAQAGSGYLIDEVRQTADWQLYLQNGALYLEHTNELQRLLSLSKANLQEQELGAISLSPSTGTVYVSLRGERGMTIHQLQNGELSYLFAVGGEDAVISSLSEANGFLAINYTYSTELGRQSRGMLFSLADRMPVQIMGRADLAYWADDELVLYTERDGQVVRWQYHPQSALFKLWP